MSYEESASMLQIVARVMCHGGACYEQCLIMFHDPIFDEFNTMQVMSSQFVDDCRRKESATAENPCNADLSCLTSDKRLGVPEHGIFHPFWTTCNVSQTCAEAPLLGTICAKAPLLKK